MSSTPISIIKNSEPKEGCFSCPLFDSFSTTAAAWVEKTSVVMIDPMWNLFLAVCGVWVVVCGLKMFIGKLKPEKFSVDVFFVIIAATLLKSNEEGLIRALFEVSLEVIAGASTVIFQAAIDSEMLGKTAFYKGISRLIYAAEISFQKGPFQTAIAILNTFSMTNILSFVKALFILLPYTFLLGLYAIQAVVAVATVMIISALSPFLALGFGFDFFRSMAWDGFRTLIGAAISLFSCTVVLSAIVFATRHLTRRTEAGEIDIKALESSTEWSDPIFLGTVFLGIIGSGLMTHSISIANSIAKSALSNTAAGVMAAQIGGIGAMAFKASRTTLGAVANPVGTAAQVAGKFSRGMDALQGGEGFAEQFNKHRGR